MFKMTFTDGDTLIGTFQQQGPAHRAFRTGPYGHRRYGGVALYRGTLTGTSIGNLADGTCTTTGRGTLDTSQTPEPESIVLLATGWLACSRTESGHFYSVRIVDKREVQIFSDLLVIRPEHSMTRRKRWQT